MERKEHGKLQQTEEPPWFDFSRFISILLTRPSPSSLICLIKSSCSSPKSPSHCDTPVPNLGQKTASAAAARSRESAAHVSAPQERTVQIKRGRINYSWNTCKETRMCGRTLPTPNVQSSVWASRLIDRAALTTRVFLAAPPVRRLAVQNLQEKQTP